MAVASILSRAQWGLDAPLVHVEIHLGAGLPAFTIVGLPAPVVRESRERVRAALLNSGFDFPPGRITVNLAPVELAKEGARFDLPIAVGLLVASGAVTPSSALRFECYGELGLGGELKPVRGLFLAALHAARSDHVLYVPTANVTEALLAGHTRVVGVDHLRSLRASLSAPRLRSPTGSAALHNHGAAGEPPDPHALAHVLGQWQAKRALIVAAAGGHSLLMIGPPGSGKSLLASCLPSLLPPLTRDEALEVASIASTTDLGIDERHWRARPFRAPHHTASASAMVGGGPRLRPGEISFAHRGVLFLDELPEFDRRVLESLREPMESGRVTIVRASGRLTLPAEFQLVAAMNPCPCGHLGDERHECACTVARIRAYRAKISGPLLDRIDIRLEVPHLRHDERQASAPPAAELAAIARIPRVRLLSQERAGCFNARLRLEQLASHCRLQSAAERLMARSRDQLGLSARGEHRLLRLSRTIADLAGSESIAAEHLAEAFALRRALEPAPPARVAVREVTSGPGKPGNRRPA
jgi:magnesium chelatase family protein